MIAPVPGRLTLCKSSRNQGLEAASTQAHMPRWELFPIVEPNLRSFMANITRTRQALRGGHGRMRKLIQLMAN